MRTSQPQWTGPTESHPLDSPRGKLVRAAQQADLLHQHCEAFAERNPIRLRAQFDGKSGTHLVFVEARRPPLYLGLILGEVIHDLRSALDQLAWQLAIAHSGLEVVSRGNVIHRIVFPIRETMERFNRDTAVKHVSPDATWRMETLQPYHDPGSGRVNPLRLLQHLSNADKHRALTPSLGRFGAHQIRCSTPIPSDRMERLIPVLSIIDTAAPLFRIHLPEQTQIEFEPLRMSVLFGTDVTGELKDISPKQVLDLCGHTSDVVHRFADLFPEVDWRQRAESWKTPEL